MHDLTIAQAANAIRVGTFSAVELMEALLARSCALDPKLRVWETLDEGVALDAARSAQAEIESAGPKGPLHGVPIGIKDIFNTEGVRTASGSPIYDDYVPDFDSTAVARLRAAGAVVMGKAVTTEFASFDPSPTRNPWNAEHTPGGSSSGSAAGVAARLFPAALGSQTSGSVLRPASYNGVVGLKPTFGRISRYGVTPVAWSLDTVGYFTRTVEDAAIMLDALAGRDDLDPSSSREPVLRYAEAAANTASAPRIGVVRSFFFDYADDETVAHTEQVLGRLAGAGAVLEDASPSTDFDVLLAAHRTAMNVESAVTRGKDYRERPDDFSPNVRSSVEWGMLAPATAYIQAQRHRAAFRREVAALASEFDALLTPSTPTPAPRDLTTTGDASFQAPWTTAGLPAITIPSGLSASGLPFGIQLVAAPFAEAGLLSTAAWCEDVLGISLAPPVQGRPDPHS